MHNERNYDTSGFYDDISENYDEMFNFTKDLEAAEKYIAKLKKQFNFEKALDIGCGTGSCTLALAQSGAETTGIDLSKSMLDEARKNSIAYGLNIDFINCGMKNMLSKVKGKFNLLMSMGNTLPHLLNKDDLHSMLTSCKQLLNPGGQLILNLLNYDKILDTKERVIGITRSKNHEFIRFYDFHPPYVSFNLLEIDWREGNPLHKIVSTKLYPYTRLELESALQHAGFRELKIYDGLSFEEYKIESSKSITLHACS